MTTADELDSPPDPTPLSDAEIAVARAATPGCRPDLVHLNHAGASLPPQVVVDTQINYLLAEARTGGYEAAAATRDRGEAVYDSIADLIGARIGEIARFEHATAAWNAAFWSVPMQRGQRIIVHDHEYGANTVAFLLAAERRGVKLVRVPSGGDGAASVDGYVEALGDGDGVALASLTHIPTNGGLVNPAEEIGAACRAVDVPLLIDACQSVGQRVVDVERIGCDFLSVTGRKFLRGPRGSGFLYVSERVLDRVEPAQPDHDGALLVSSDRFEWAPGARRFEHWEFNHAAWLGLGCAVDYALGWGLGRIEATVVERAAQLRALLCSHDFVVHDEGSEMSAIVTVTSPRHPVRAMHAALTEAGVNSTYTIPGSSRWDVDRRGVAEMLRLSVHYTTTEEELHRAVAVLADS